MYDLQSLSALAFCIQRAFEMPDPFRFCVVLMEQVWSPIEDIIEEMASADRMLPDISPDEPIPLVLRGQSFASEGLEIVFLYLNDITSLLF